ncbi:protein kinase domain-containing protein [Streptomyces sp. NPDC004126]|uniref:serine/threonine-protein kinase n=1 Tax=Streptomyces sp. NPDC004126 TaxID=3390695 RepID=UPI003D08EE41
MLELRGSGAEPLEADDPRLIGRTVLAGRLGAGGMGRVYLGVLDGRYVAVKQLLASVVGEDEDFRRRFGHELDNLARLPEKATAPLLDSDRTANPPWFATAYIPGLTLREALALHGGPLPARALWLLLREAAAGLAAVHALDMVHRDLKPSNVMLTTDGLTLIDFGVARAAEQSQLTRTGMVVGTPAYMAPEQASGAKALSGATDVFALGSVLAYAACGRPPFGEESGHGVLYRIVHEDPDLEPLRELDAGLADVVAGCLAKDPGDRPTAAELLERASEQGPFEAPPWPRAIAERLAERAAFAADVQEVDVPTLPLVGGKPAPEAATPAAAAPAERRRRTRVLLAVLPVVVVAGGTTLAVQYLPHVTAPSGAGAQPSGSVPAPGSAQGPAPAAQTPSSVASGAQPSASGGSPSGAASAPPGQQPPGQEPGASQPPPPAANTGTGPAAGTGTAPTAGTPNGQGGATGAPAGGGTPPKPTPPPASGGTHRYGNGNNGQCITQVFGASDYGSCSDSTARWTVRSQGDGSFRLVNQQTGGCLYGNMLGQAVFVGDCDQDLARTWRTGSGGTLRNDWNGGCLDLGMSSGLVTNSCNGNASQRWSPQ